MRAFTGTSAVRIGHAVVQAPIVTSSEAPGTPAGVQLAAVNQSDVVVVDVPFQL